MKIPHIKIYKLLAKGYSCVQIASKTNITTKTIEGILKRDRDKYKFKNSIHAIYLLTKKEII